MLSEENKKNLDSFKTAMRQEVRNAGYFLEDIPDMIQEKKLERAYEKELAAKDELEKLKREEVLYRLRLRDCGYTDIEEAYGQANTSRTLPADLHSASKCYVRQYSRRYVEIRVIVLCRSACPCM